MSKYTANIQLQNKNNVTTLIFDHVKRNSRVLDVGCASGYLAELLVKEKGCKVVGIELDKTDAKKAEKFCEFVLTEDIEGEGWEEALKNEKFDHIVFSDVLEHLKEPQKTLERVKTYLKVNGSVLVSIPNISHVSIRLELLSGNFVPEPVGILDNTHLQYFTKEKFTNTLNAAGFKIKSSASSVFDFPEKKIKEMLEQLGFTPNAKALKLLSSEEAVSYQYFFELIEGKSKDSHTTAYKPIYIVRDFLKSVEDDHEKFKNNELKVLNNTLQENERLKETIKTLENELIYLRRSVFNVVNAKTQKVLKKLLSKK